VLEANIDVDIEIDIEVDRWVHYAYFEKVALEQECRPVTRSRFRQSSSFSFVSSFYLIIF